MSILKILNQYLYRLRIAIPFTVLTEDTGKPGEEKKKLVVDRVKDELAKLGFTLLEWVQKYQDFILGAVVDVVVAILNRIGFSSIQGLKSPTQSQYQDESICGRYKTIPACGEASQRGSGEAK
ncbi:MAG: hypothetical protein HPY71_11550 [Firmicutes bacterium]|nr:hypothetical protein [Bacillota bacterium]